MHATKHSGLEGSKENTILKSTVLCAFPLGISDNLLDMNLVPTADLQGHAVLAPSQRWAKRPIRQSVLRQVPVPDPGTDSQRRGAH